MTVAVRLSMKTSTAKFYNSSNFPSQTLVKTPAQDSIKLSPKLGANENSSSELKQRLHKWDVGESFTSKLNQIRPNLRFSNSSNSGLEQRFPKRNFIESSSLRFDFLLPMPVFSCSSNSGLEHKRPKWNLTENSAWSSTIFKVKLCWKWDLIYPVLGLNQTIPKVRFGCNSNSGPYNEFPSKALVKFSSRCSIKKVK